MAFLPGILVSTQKELEHLLSLLPSEKEDFLEETHQYTYAFHIDSILPLFADERNVRPTLDTLEVLHTILKQFANESIRFNIHIMGLDQESLAELDRILTYISDQKIYGEIYVPSGVYDYVKNKQNDRWVVGIWYDLEEWLYTPITPKSSEFLLMTVTAGKSGQKADEQVKSAAVQLCDQYPQFYPILDGGWKVSEDFVGESIECVVNSDYWKTKM